VQKIRKALACLREGRYRRALLAHGVAAGVEHSAALRSLDEIRTVVDIGANRGQFSLVASEAFPGCRIFAFEPLQEPASVYRDVFAKQPGPQLIEAAIGPERSTAVIHVSRRDDSSSLLPISARQTELFPGTEEASRRSVPVGPLTDYVDLERIEGPALLKLDVQGFEAQALAGCSEAMHRFDAVYVECSFVELYEGQALADAVLRTVQGHGFQLEGVYNLSKDQLGRAIQADFLLRRAR
jgi:FkbM family methyltransferase